MPNALRSFLGRDHAVTYNTILHENFFCAIIAPKLSQGAQHGYSSPNSFIRPLDHHSLAVIIIVKFAISWAANSLFKAMDRGLTSAFSGLMDLQVTLGLIYLIWNGIAVAGFPTYRILHGVTMIIAAAVAHLPSRFKNLNDKLRFQYSCSPFSVR